MISRRIFIRHGGLALVSLGFAPSFLTRTVDAAGNARRKVLVTIFQRGAVDGLNMVVPYGEQDYYTSRPTIGIARPGSADVSALDLDGFFAFHPRLAPLQKLYARRELAIVHACGSPDSTRSHFDAQDYMETGTPGRKSTTDGWLNRYLQAKHAEEHSSFRAVSLTQQLPRMLQGREAALAVNQIGQFGIRGNDMMSASLESQYAGASDSVAWRHGARSIRCHQDLAGRDAAEVSARQRRRVSTVAVRAIDAADRSTHQIRSRARNCVCRSRRMGQSREPRRRDGTARRAARMILAEASPHS